MRKKIIIAAVILLLVILITAGTIIAPSKETITYELEGDKYELLLAQTPDEWETGLMNIRQLNNADGMVFLFPDKKVRSFWNKNTYLDLAVFWMDGDKILGRKFLPSIETQGLYTVTSPSPVDRVIEIVVK